MELNQLACFLQVAETEHMTQAAERLHITQPALSRSIARLEEELGVKLFDREGKGIRLNEYGQVALRYTQQVMYTLGDMQAELAELSEGQAGHVRIGSAFPSHEPNFLLEAVRYFAMARPDVRFSLIQYSSRNLTAALEERKIDIAVTSTPIHKDGILWHELFTEKMGIILSVHHPLAAREVISMCDLQQERFYCNNTNSDVYDLTYRFCSQAGFRPFLHFEGEFPSFIAEAVSHGYGVSIISARGFLRSKRLAPQLPWEDDVVFRPLAEPYCQRTCGIARLSSRSAGCAIGAFYEHLLHNCHEAAE